MIEQDLLGISVNDLIKNYCVLYDKETEKEIGISSIKNAEAIDKKYGNSYEERYLFVDIFAADLESIQKNQILSYYEIEKKLEDYIGYVPDPEVLNYMASCMHSHWVETTKDAAKLLLDLLKIILANQELISDKDVAVVSDVKECVDNWRKNWCVLYVADNETKIKNGQLAKKILEELHEKGELDDNR